MISPSDPSFHLGSPAPNPTPAAAPARIVHCLVAVAVEIRELDGPTPEAATAFVTSLLGDLPLAINLGGIPLPAVAVLVIDPTRDLDTIMARVATPPAPDHSV